MFYLCLFHSAILFGSFYRGFMNLPQVSENRTQFSLPKKMVEGTQLVIIGSQQRKWQYVIDAPSGQA